MKKHYSPRNPVLVLIGPSGSGKSTIAAELAMHDSPCFQIVSKYTTRPSRQTEDQVVTEDIFINDDVFDDMVRKGLFMGTVEPFGLPFRYGLPWLTNIKPGSIPLVLLRSFVLDQFTSHYPQAIIYQLSVDKKTSTERMHKRGQSAKDIQARSVSYDKELQAGTLLASKTFLNTGNITHIAHEILNAYKKDVSSLL